MYNRNEERLKINELHYATKGRKGRTQEDIEKGENEKVLVTNKIENTL